MVHRHTSGPWTIGSEYDDTLGDYWRVNTTDSHRVANVWLREADARLIAAAPDLLRAARAILEAGYEEVLQAAFGRNGPIDEFTDLVAAVRKTEGEAG